ncbi:N-acetylglucosamine kinase [Paenibacillus wulumuqiensis]|uniref:N-acetylglucosamine kinase n=1 Tax=Paenibacillus wulumuqiensis TaxID=1567107 RepID=UPI00061918B7|nr:BadF/BadG/BcrA/BcrD ATPase family protein [Paenibacillus wulumuqiensis]
MNYYLGIDAGGTKTLAYVTDDHGHLLGRGLAGNGNHQVAGQLAADHIGMAADQALRQAGIRLEQLAFSCFGLAGADRQTDYDILHPMIRGLGFVNYEIVCDTIIGLRAGTRRPYGLSVICGTGTNSAGVSPDGEIFQCGGFDYMYGDFGGGGSLSIEVFRTVIRAWDGREQPTVLTGLLLEMLGYPDVSTMFNDYLDHHRSVPLRAAELLFTAAARGDSAALDILTRQGREIGRSVTAIVHRLGMQEETFDVVMAGSLLTRGDRGWISPHIESAMRSCAPHASLVRLDMEPVVGAILRAMDHTGATIHESVYKTLREHGSLHPVSAETIEP